MILSAARLSRALQGFGAAPFTCNFQIKAASSGFILPQSGLWNRERFSQGQEGERELSEQRAKSHH